MNTIKSISKYIYDSIQNYETNDLITVEAVELQVQETLVEDVSEYFHENDIERLEEHIDNDEAIENYFLHRFPNYEEKLNDIAKDILTEYVIADLQNE